MLIPGLAFAVPVDLGTFSPAGLPVCTLTASDLTAISTSPAQIQAHIGDTITISMTVTNGTFSHENILRVNNSYNYAVTLPIQVTASVAGVWQIEYESPGCQGSEITITTQ